MELRRENGVQRKPCLCILSNMDEDDVVMHDADCSYCDGGFLETAFLEDNEFDIGSCLTYDDIESTVGDEGCGATFKTEEKVTGRCQEVHVKFSPKENVNVKRVVIVDKEAQLNKYIATLQRNNVRLLQRFQEVQEDKKRAECMDEEWRRKKKSTVSLMVRFSPLSGHRSVSLAEKERKKSRRRNRER